MMIAKRVLLCARAELVVASRNILGQDTITPQPALLSGPNFAALATGQASAPSSSAGASVLPPPTSTDDVEVVMTDDVGAAGGEDEGAKQQQSNLPAVLWDRPSGVSRGSVRSKGSVSSTAVNPGTPAGTGTRSPTTDACAAVIQAAFTSNRPVQRGGNEDDACLCFVLNSQPSLFSFVHSVRFILKFCRLLLNRF